MDKSEIARLDNKISKVEGDMSDLKVSLAETNGALHQLISRIDQMLSLSQTYITQEELKDKLDIIHERFNPVRTAVFWVITFGAGMVLTAVGVLIFK